MCIDMIFHIHHIVVIVWICMLYDSAHVNWWLTRAFGIWHVRFLLDRSQQLGRVLGWARLRAREGRRLGLGAAVHLGNSAGVAWCEGLGGWKLDWNHWFLWFFMDMMDVLRTFKNHFWANIWPRKKRMNMKNYVKININQINHLWIDDLIEHKWRLTTLFFAWSV